MKKLPPVSDEKIIDKIYLIRGQKIMLDRDLALLYNVPTKALKQAVRRKRERFPIDFMFEMSPTEFLNWRSQIVTSNSRVRMGLRYPPFCFTEHGVAMLSSVLNTRQAIEMNIRIIRAFSRMRQLMLSHKDILIQLEQLERKVNKNDGDIQMIFEALKQLLNSPSRSRRKIGFKHYD